MKVEVIVMEVLMEVEVMVEGLVEVRVSMEVVGGINGGGGDSDGGFGGGLWSLFTVWRSRGGGREPAASRAPPSSPINNTGTSGYSSQSDELPRAGEGSRLLVFRFVFETTAKSTEQSSSMARLR